MKTNLVAHELVPVVVLYPVLGERQRQVVLGRAVVRGHVPEGLKWSETIFSKRFKHGKSRKMTHGESVIPGASLPQEQHQKDVCKWRPSPDSRHRHGFSGGAIKWIDIENFESFEESIDRVFR